MSNYSLEKDMTISFQTGDSMSEDKNQLAKAIALFCSFGWITLFLF